MRVCVCVLSFESSRCDEGILPARQSPHGSVERSRGPAGLQQGSGSGPEDEEGCEEGAGPADDAHGGEEAGGQEKVQGHVLNERHCGVSSIKKAAVNTLLSVTPRSEGVQ